MVAVLVLILLAACGDNDVRFPPSDDYAERCAHPRAGIDPYTGNAYPDTQGSTADEDTWVRSWIDEYYLWYREVPNYHGDDFSTVVDYFEALRTQAVTASGRPKDRFHFTYPTDEWEGLSLTGTDSGYGASFAVLAPAPPRIVVVAYTDPNTPADGVLVRGDVVLTVDGVDVVSGNDVATLNAGLFPATDGEMHTFTVKRSGAEQTVTLTSGAITETPVQHVSMVAPGVGYLLFNDHILTAEKELADAIAQLQGVSDLVLDMRYNGGGYLVIASELAYMIAGPTVTAGRTFEREQFNDKYPDTDPIAGGPNEPTPFVDKTVFQDTNVSLPHLDLSRVFVLVGPNTCSASEAVINGLRGVGVQVVLIGDTTCGKPYGFYPADNCGTTYFAIQFEGVNDMGFGDYADGFTPDCTVADDLDHQLGDPAELRLAAALQYRMAGACPSARFAPRDGTVRKPLTLQNRILRRL